MIGKLMKYDLKKMFRILIYIYIVSVILAGLTRFIKIWQDIQAIAILGYIFDGITYSAIGSILVNTFVHIIKVFICNFYKDESYLTHTLPVNKNKLLLSKYLSGLIVILASVAVCVVDLFIMFYSESFMLGIKTMIEMVVSGFNISAGLFLTIIILVIFAQICAIMSMSFTAIIVANMYNTKRVLKGVLWIAAFYFGSMIMTLLSAVIIFAIGGNLAELTAQVMSYNSFITIIILGLVLYVVYAISFYFVSQKLFNKGVNVD